MFFSVAGRWADGRQRWQAEGAGREARLSLRMRPTRPKTKEVFWSGFVDKKIPSTRSDENLNFSRFVKKKKIPSVIAVARMIKKWSRLNKKCSLQKMVIFRCSAFHWILWFAGFSKFRPLKQISFERTETWIDGLSASKWFSVIFLNVQFCFLVWLYFNFSK